MPNITSINYLRVMALLSDGDDHYGIEIAAATGIATGVLYPLLNRMEETFPEMIESYWAEPEGSPSRRYYRLTKDGKKWARRVLNRTIEELTPA